MCACVVCMCVSTCVCIKDAWISKGSIVLDAFEVQTKLDMHWYVNDLW